MKDQLFNADKVAGLACRFAPPFDAKAFEADVMARLPELELKARIDWIAECCVAHLPDDFPAAVAAIRAALPPPLDPTLSDDDFGDFIYAPLGEFAVKAGLETHPDLALDLLEDLTQRFSMEWALRPFLNRWPERTWAKLEAWVVHDSYHVRRLVSEGTRPKLPWGMGIDLASGAALPLLEKLAADRTRFVTRSVCNHLNDISKTKPDLVLDTLDLWRDGIGQTPAEMGWMTRHALRGLVKAGAPRALALLGYDPEAEMRAELSLSPAKVAMGEALEITCAITTKKALPVLVDYILHFHRPGRADGRKVFKLKQGKTAPGVALKMGKRHPLKGNATTFRLYPGPHRIELQVNGRVRAEAAFELLEAPG